MKLTDLIIERAMEKVAGVVTPEMVKASVATVKNGVNTTELLSRAWRKLDKSYKLLESRKSAAAERLLGELKANMSTVPHKEPKAANWAYKNLRRSLAGPVYDKLTLAENLVGTLDWQGNGSLVSTDTRRHLKRLADNVKAYHKKASRVGNLNRYLDNNRGVDISKMEPDLAAKIFNSIAANYKTL